MIEKQISNAGSRYIYIYIWRENKDGNKQWEPLLIYIEEVKMGMGIGVESWNQDKATERGIPARVLVTTYKAFHIFKTLTWFIWNTLSICKEIGRKYYFGIWDIMVILINSKTKKVVREREREGGKCTIAWQQASVWAPHLGFSCGPWFLLVSGDLEIPSFTFERKRCAINIGQTKYFKAWML